MFYEIQVCVLSSTIQAEVAQLFLNVAQYTVIYPCH